MMKVRDKRLIEHGPCTGTGTAMTDGVPAGVTQRHGVIRSGNPGLVFSGLLNSVFGMTFYFSQTSR